MSDDDRLLVCVEGLALDAGAVDEILSALRPLFAPDDSVISFGATGERAAHIGTILMLLQQFPVDALLGAIAVIIEEFMKSRARQKRGSDG